MRYASKADAENIRSRPITETRPIKANRNKDNTGIKSTKNMIYRNITFYGKITAV